MPLVLPDYVDRPQIATYLGNNRIDYAEFDRWAEPLRANMTRVLQEEFTAAMPGAEITLYPWSPQISPKYRISIDITRMDLFADGRALLTATWSIGSGPKGPWLKTGHSRLTDSYSEGKKPDYSARVGALNRLVIALGGEITDVLTGLVKDQP